MNGYILILIVAVSAGISSCSSTLKVSDVNPKTGQFPTDLKVTQEEVLVNKEIDLAKYKQFLYIQQNGVHGEKYEQYVKDMLKSIGGFDSYMGKAELEKFVIDNELTDKVTSISDNIGLLNLQKEIGDFLICESTVEYVGGYEYIFSFKIIDPSKSDIILNIKHKAFNWSGLDRPLFHPVFNYYRDWLNGNNLSTAYIVGQ